MLQRNSPLATVTRRPLPWTRWRRPPNTPDADTQQAALPGSVGTYAIPGIGPDIPVGSIEDPMLLNTDTMSFTTSVKEFDQKLSADISLALKGMINNLIYILD